LKNIFNLENKVALIFGGNGFLGKQFCETLLDYGATVYSCDINHDKETVKELKRDFNDNFFNIKVDASNKKKLLELKETIMKREKKVDILLNTVTMKGDDFYQPFEKVSLEGWNKGILGNLTIPFLVIQSFIPEMKKKRNGSIINIASHYGIVGNDQRIYKGSNLNEVYTKNNSEKSKNQIYSHGVYNAAKGGLINFTRYLAAYYGIFNIRVNCISPGGVLHPKENKEFLKKYSKKVPLGRKANPDEINGAVIFLASDASTYVTGHNLVVDGGYTIW
jgi:NAD(P)-dependent dehydrogenase (short-subunit alcohol dehydrogenase family)